MNLVPIPAVLLQSLSPLPHTNRYYRGITVILIHMQFSSFNSTTQLHYLIAELLSEMFFLQSAVSDALTHLHPQFPGYG